MVSATSSEPKFTIVNTPRLSPADLPTRHVYTLEPGLPTPGWLNLLRPPIAFQVGAGILTRFPSTTALALILGADSPCADERGAGNLGLSASRPFTCFIATHVSIRTSDTSSKGYPSPSQAYGTLSYHPGIRIQRTEIRNSHRFVSIGYFQPLMMPCSILAIAWYSSRQPCQVASSM